MISREDGQHTAKVLAYTNKSAISQLLREYGDLLSRSAGDVPTALLAAHVLRVNSHLLSDPGVSEGTRGFMRTSIEDARGCNVEWKDLSDPAISIYAYSHGFNNRAHELALDYPDIFTNPHEDFWRCAYLKQTLGDRPFEILWGDAGLTSNDVGAAYPRIMETIDTRRKYLLYWPIITLRRVVFSDCEYVFKLATSSGSLVSSGTGQEPLRPE